MPAASALPAPAVPRDAERSISLASASSPIASSTLKRPLDSSSQARPKRSPSRYSAASSVSRRSSRNASSVTVPGVTTRTTWRSTGPFAFGGIADLLADRDRLAAAHEPREVTFGAVIRHARHRDRLACRLAARRQRDVEQARRALRVVVEQLVEIAHPIEQQRVGVLRLEAQVLLHDGGVLRGRFWKSGACSHLIGF